MSSPRDLTVAVGEHETLIAQELLRQRLLPDGGVENLVRWCLSSQNKKSNTSDNESTSTSSSDDNKQSKYVFLWMTNQEVLECCPNLWCTDTTTTPPRQTDEPNDGHSDSAEASSDVEDLDDMRHDVIKLVNRARKQMHRVKNISKPFASLSHTIKVLSTYAGLGSLCDVFRETGALDLILELLWTNDVDTRRAAGRMLRALALHDAGSRAYVLLSLTQDEPDESADSNKQQYADFENRVMVMEMFAETASGEEAHAVALDSVQLPQVPGKALFTLMKCYLRVMSLLDMGDSKNQERNKKRCSWMSLNSDETDETINQFEVAMAISDLIFELNRIMDWNGLSKSLQVNTENHKCGLNKTTPAKQPRSDPSPSSSDSSAVERCSPKPLFAERLQDTTLDPSLLASLIKSDQPSTIYKQPSSFSTRRQYANYVKSVIKPGYTVRACQGYQDVSEGDEGVYRQHNESTPPVQIFWHRLNRVYWVYWHHIQILSSGEAAKQNAVPPKFIVDPDTSILWPLLSGMKTRPKQIYGFQSNVDKPASETTTQTDPTQCEWWLLLFYISKLSRPAREKIRSSFLEKFPSCKHMCVAKPNYDTSLELMRQLLQEASEQDKTGMGKSTYCKNLMDAIHKEEEAEKKLKELEEKPSTSKEADKMDVEEKEGQTENADIPCTSSTSAPAPPTSSTADSSTSANNVAEEEDKVSRMQQTYGSMEEYARAIEMGLRISLIQDDATERKFGKMLLEEENYRVAERSWRMQQEGEKLNTISAMMEKSEKPTKIIVLTVLHGIVSRTDVGVPDRRAEVEIMFSNILPSSESTDPIVVTCYMTLVAACCKEQGGESCSRELDSLELALATSGHLKAAFDIIARFPGDRKIVEQATHIICTIMGAREFCSNPKANSSYTNIIIAIISSIMVTVAGESGPKKNLIAFFLQAIEDIMNKMAECATETDNLVVPTEESMKVLMDACCIICLVLRKDQSKSLLAERETLQRIVVTGLKTVPHLSKVRRMLLRIKGLVVSAFKSDVLDDDDDAETADDKLLDLSEDGFAIGHFSVTPSNTNLEEEFSDCLKKIKEKQQPEAKESTRNLIRNTVLPLLKKSTPLANGFVVCVGQLKDFIAELSGLAQELNLLLLDTYWSELVSSLHGVLEQCVSGAEVVKSTLHEVSADCISILLTLAEMDRDFAVELCGLEAKQTITRLVEKHGTVAKATELKELVTSCERHRALHSKLLAVVLGGCISTALRCVEDARRRRMPINVPLFDQLLDNLCRGADVEMKEDKCYDRLEVSTNPRQVGKLTDGNPATYWESNGSSGAHWINIFMRKGVVVRKLSILVAQEDSSYMPARIVVLGGTTSSDVTTQLSCVTLSSTDREVVVLENARRYWPLVRISIRRCQQGGIDTRIHGLEVIGPKPSFWPILRRQLFIRTNLTYSVQSQTWVAEAAKNSHSSPIHQHPILDLPTKITRALNFEQGFANDFLPNPESALVLGQACRAALSSPILKALLKNADEESLLSRLLVAYVGSAKLQSASRDQRIFASKLRRLTRLLVDLDSHEQRSPASRGNSKPAAASNFSMWNKRVHSKSAKFANVESSKVSTAESVGSAADGAGACDRDAPTDAEDDNFLSSSHVNDVCKCWSRVVESRFGEHVDGLFADAGASVTKERSFEICRKLVEEFTYLQECTQQVFGHRARFAGAFAVGVWKSFMSLKPADAMRVSVTCAHVIHEHVTNRSPLGYVSIERLLAFLQTVAGSDFCRVFEQVFSASLAARLLRPRADVDVESEQRVMAKLQPCFPERRPISMLQDLAYSRNRLHGFLADYLERLDVASQSDAVEADELLDNYQRLCSGEFRVATLRPSAWSAKPAARGAVESLLGRLDQRMSYFVRQFSQYERRDGALKGGFGSGPNAACSLHWTLEGTATVWDNASRVELRVTTAQMLILLHFNHATIVTEEEWMKGVGGFASDALQRLIDARVIHKQAEATYTAAERNEKDLDCVPSGEEEILALWDSHEQVERHVERRRTIIDCAVVRVMKKKQECLGDLLVEHVLRYCREPDASEFAPPEGAKHEPFLPSARDVRARCEHLVHLGYLLRTDFSPQNLLYNPDSTQQQQEEKSSDGAAEEASDASLAGASSDYLSAPKDGVIPKESVIVQVDTSVKFPIESHAAKTNCEKPKPSAASPDVPVVSDPSTTTLSTDDVLEKLKGIFATVAAVLEISTDVSEALAIRFDWNVDKLIESYMVSPAKTLSSVGVPSPPVKPSTPDEEASCPVCLNALVPTDSLTPPCGHTCCKNCWKTYLELQLKQDASANTTCPVSDCAARAVTSLFAAALDGDKDQLRKHAVALVRAYVQSDRALSWCHNPKGCEHILRRNADGCDSGWCSACSWQTCFTCTYVEAHYPASCGHMSQWVDDGGYYEGMNEDAQSKHLARLIAKRCPNCQANIEKNDGCLHMKCAKCSYDFCWRCLQSWRPSHRDYYNCSSKVSKLAHSGQKFVAYSKRCQFHNQAKQFAFRVYDRVLATRAAGASLPRVQFALDLCVKLAHCRKVLAYCNVFSYYSADTERMNAIGLHSSALENKTLALQALMSDVLLKSADIQYALEAISDSDVTEGRRVMAECDVMLDNILVFSKQDMKVAAKSDLETTAGDDGGLSVGDDKRDGREGFSMVFNSRPAGMSDDDDASSDSHSYSYSSDSSDNVMSMPTSDDSADAEEDDEDDDDDMQGNLFSTDDDGDMLW